MSKFEAIMIELESIETALNLITVKGEYNLNRLLGSIQTVRKVRKELEEAMHADCDEQGND